MQRYGDFGLIPRNLPNSCRSCCDKGMYLRQSRGRGFGVCRKVHKKGKEIRKYFFLPFFMEICWFFKEKPLSLHSE